MTQTAETTRSTPTPSAAGRDCIALDSVSKIYGTFAALRNVTTSFCTGSSTVILGENGAGKSTLLRIIAGLITPTRGRVTVFCGSPHQQRRRIAYMSHSPMLYDELTAIENLNYFSSLHREGGCACVGNPEMALRAVGLDPKLNRPVGQYSQGMRQRTSLARVLQTDPEILLLDEPFSNLDAASARHMVELLADFRTWPVAPVNGVSGARTILLTTHQSTLAEPIADRTLTMHNGQILDTHWQTPRTTDSPAEAAG
ncbi:ABC transporter ATP-binding protein [Tunturiibacter empetritectus]|uniref:ABC-type multidrug transport system ATPase subunit n=1 Tax=Tunturiibacter lichenicola TaxID=2051959 RepID=A0A852VCK4_9BACT|nr:ABC transporter ATP-binding protein [Edaphobacter lichenicola]NYF89011.1 ABC-type multidrug transport system ATPase subunit [Edaphobacter lichenicola]